MNDITTWSDYKEAKRAKLLEERRAHCLASYQPLGIGWYREVAGGVESCGYGYHTIEAAARGMMISIDVEMHLWVKDHAAMLERWMQEEMGDVTTV